ncbi:MAG: hypothetical protein LBH22_01155, partial [Bacteroidales bacterium]|nr:hypothetical protein [Bacteroidales bacterium]
AQDWEGFRELVEKSNIQDKQLILSVFSMYRDSEQREKEIKNLSSVFSVLADEEEGVLARGVGKIFINK